MLLRSSVVPYDQDDTDADLLFDPDGQPLRVPEGWTYSDLRPRDGVAASIERHLPVQRLTAFIAVPDPRSDLDFTYRIEDEDGLGVHRGSGETLGSAVEQVHDFLLSQPLRS